MTEREEELIVSLPDSIIKQSFVRRFFRLAEESEDKFWRIACRLIQDVGFEDITGTGFYHPTDGRPWEHGKDGLMHTSYYCNRHLKSKPVGHPHPVGQVISDVYDNWGKNFFPFRKHVFGEPTPKCCEMNVFGHHMEYNTGQEVNREEWFEALVLAWKAKRRI